MKLHLFAAAAATLLCAAPIVSADADALELNNLDFEEQKDSLLLDKFISESEGSEISKKQNDQNDNDSGNSGKKEKVSKDKGKDKGPKKDKGKDKGPSPSRTSRPRNRRTPRPSKDKDSSTSRPRSRKTPRPTKKDKATSRPTRRPRGRSTRRPTRRPNRPPSSQRRTIRELMDRNWRFDQCVPRRRDMSFWCEELDCYICAQGRRNINRRMENICERVGLPFRDQRNRCGNGSRRVREAEEEVMAYAAEESDSMKSEDMDMDMEEVEVGVSESKDEFDSIESEDTEFVSAAKATKSRRGISMSISRSGKSGKGDKMAVVFASE